jgi:predicted Zn-dependent protease
MAEYFLDDGEFAAVIAHEMAHNLLKHRDRLNAQRVNRGFFGQFGKSAGRIKDSEIEADRLSVWLMANAGYDPQAAIRFWTRYGKEHGKGIFSASTHYRWKKRVELFEEEMKKMAAIEPVDGKYPPPLLTR